MSTAATESQPPNLRDATQIESLPGSPGHYRANLSSAWDAPVHPSGGVVTAVALRAEVRSPGRREIGHVTTAAFGESRTGIEFSYSAAPEAGPPDDYPPPADPPPGAPVFRARFFENVETRRVRMFHSFEKDWEGGRAEAIRWFRYRVAPRLPDGRLDPLALIGLADTMPPAVGQYLGPGQWFFHAPSIDLSMHFFAETDGDWLLARNVCHWAGDGYASAEITLWDERRRLLAFATQVMLLRIGDPAELGIP